MSSSMMQPEGSSRIVQERASSQPKSQSEYDLVCIGFGTTSLALAAALADHDPSARVLFVERKGCFSWGPSHVLPDRSAGSSFLRDLITTRNPQSEYTFMNFLHATDQLVLFANNSQMTPTRLLMGRYFSWAAEKIQKLGWVHYGQEATCIKPVTSSASSSSSVVQWSVEVKDVKTGRATSVQSRRMVVSTGSETFVPPALSRPESSSSILHSSASGSLLESLEEETKPLNIAIVGANEEAAEIFEHLHSVRGEHRADLFIADSALRPEDGSQFTQQLIDSPSMLPPELRERSYGTAAPSQGPRVDLRVLESLYEAQYIQRLTQPEPSKWRFRLRPHSEITGVEEDGKKIRLVIRNPLTGAETKSERPFDVVIAATGYKFAEKKSLIASATPMLDSNTITVDSEYRVNLRRNLLAPGCGLWLLGSLKDRKIRDDNLSSLAERAGRIASSVLKQMSEQGKADQKFGGTAML